MSDTGTFDAPQWMKAICLGIAGCAIFVFTWRSSAQPLWLDELLTMTLLQANSLPKLWAGIVVGIDGNPPLYLTLAWLVSHLLPEALLIPALKLAGVTITIAATFALYRVSVRVASPVASWVGVFVLAALNDSLIYAALELRTYAIYYLMAALAVLLQQRLIERRRGIDILTLGIVYGALTVAHTFGIVYVGCIALAGWLSQYPNRWRNGKATILAVVPAILVLACWIPYFIKQIEVGRPYPWFGRPGLSDLLQTIFSSPLSMWVAIVEFYCLASAAIWFVHNHGLSALRPVLYESKWQPYRYVTLVALGILGFPLAAWIESQFLIPLMVPRYFTPQLVFSLALHIAFFEWILRLLKKRFPDGRTSLMVPAIVIPPVLLCLALIGRNEVRWEIPCATSNGAFFETDFLRNDLPVITESSHIFVPRIYYGSRPSVYRFALDWDVVLKYPNRGSGNATDYNILHGLKDWANMTSILTTDEIVNTLPEFLVIEQSGRAWFHNLRQTRDVTAEKLTEVTGSEGDTCTLWKVASVKARL